MKYVRRDRKLNSDAAAAAKKWLAFWATPAPLVCPKVAGKFGRFSWKQTHSRRRQRRQMSRTFLIHFDCDGNFPDICHQIDGDNVTQKKNNENTHSWAFNMVRQTKWQQKTHFLRWTLEALSEPFGRRLTVSLEFESDSWDCQICSNGHA